MLLHRSMFQATHKSHDRSQDKAAGIVARLRVELRNHCSILGNINRFPPLHKVFRVPLCTNQTPIEGAPGVLCPGTKSLRHEADHALSSCANMASSGTRVRSQHPAQFYGLLTFLKK